jgi:D-lactate dehydrogenase (cytochrome)
MTFTLTTQIILFSFYLAPLVGHVGDGNFHLCVLFDPNDADEKGRAGELGERVARYKF